EFGESFAAAEFRKKRDAFVSLGGPYAEPTDPEIARVSKIARSTMTRLHAELMRSISRYRAQQQGGVPERVFLAGGSSSMPTCANFFTRNCGSRSNSLIRSATLRPRSQRLYESLRNRRICLAK